MANSGNTPTWVPLRLAKANKAPITTHKLLRAYSRAAGSAWEAPRCDDGDCYSFVQLLSVLLSMLGKYWLLFASRFLENRLRQKGYYRQANESEAGADENKRRQVFV